MPEPTTPMSSVAPVPLPSPSVTTPVQSGPVTPEHNWQDDYGLAVRELIEKHKRYPLMARRAGMEGVVEIDFVIARNGRLVSAVVKQSCGYAVLDRAALRAVQDVEAFPPLPVQATDQEVNFKLPLAFRLSR